jgi:hypothetical protein
MATFRKKPVVIEARQFLGSVDGTGRIVDWIRLNGHEAYSMEIGPSTHKIVIKTLEGDHIASIGDWIIKGVKGEFYPCKPDIFLETYEAVE